MGVYINPTNGQTKEQWLEENAIELPYPPTIRDLDEKHSMVCLVNNWQFTAAGVAYDEVELREFLHDDGREKRWFMVDTEKLLDPAVSPLKEYLRPRKEYFR